MASYQHISHGFEPVFDERSRILVLGSLPSVLSRKNAFYYGNPQNRFWRVMAACLGQPVPPNEGEPNVNATTGLINPSASTFTTPNANESGSAVLQISEDGLATPHAGEDENRPAALQDGESASGVVALEESIAAKKRLLLDGGIALWDVIESCDIKGSSDASIKNVVPAQVERVLETAHIGAVVCNGGTAGRLYKRYLQWQVGLAAHVLPSTSPANASWGLERLCDRWREELAPLLAAAADGTLGEAPSPSSIKRSFVTAKAPAKQASGPHVEYATVRVESPAASSWSVHKSMQGNKRANTKPELLVRGRLRAAGLGGYRLQWKVPGHPDIAWPGKRVAIEVRGCFWHRCPHCNPSTPKKNVDYWQAKFARNIERDADNLRQLQDMGWRVHIIWECQLKKRTIDATMAELLPELAAELGKELQSQPVTAVAGEAIPHDAKSRKASSADARGSDGSTLPPSKASSNDAKKTSSGKATNAQQVHAAERAALPTAPTLDGGASEPTPPQPHFMYVIECADGSLYTGYTTDVEARFARHQAGTGAKYTRGRGPLNLLAVAEFATKHDAMSAEYRFKRLTRDQKDELLAQAAKPNADFADVLREAFES